LAQKGGGSRVKKKSVSVSTKKDLAKQGNLKKMGRATDNGRQTEEKKEKKRVNPFARI